MASGLWGALGQASSVAQLVGVDALGLVSMVVQAALAARRHRDACRRLGQHVDLVGGLLRELELAELMRREATRRPLERLQGALRRCYALVRACQDDCGYLHRLLLGARMADELRAAQHEIDMYIRLIPLISLVDSSNNNRRVTATEGVPSVVPSYSDHHTRFPRRILAFTEIHVQGATKPREIRGKSLEVTVDLQEQKIMDMEAIMRLCIQTEENYPGFRKFGFFQLVDATDGFSENRNVGIGGFGTVYKGQLLDGHTVAIKRFVVDAAIFDFKSELQLVRLQHTNLIRLLGWCIHEKEKILVYEFMQKGSLDNIIFHKRKGALLNWSKRLQIIKGLAEGLLYLHKHCLIVHRDLKPNNILLDHDMNPKIADFGSAVTLVSDVAEECTRRVVGTSGYIAPEYASEGRYSLKTDVFSFGVVVLEIISGRKNFIMEKQGDTVGNLIRDVSICFNGLLLANSICVGHLTNCNIFQAWHMWRDGRLHELVDPALCDEYESPVIMRCTQVALLCAQEDPTERPTMTDVTRVLNSQSILLSDPKKPTELTDGGASTDRPSTYIGQSSKTIDITITSSAPVSTRVRIIVDPEI
ncbi:cysteine-rich receptor-like protein kinase 44 isoform X1 [Oryza sativa Japonica Group]|uniref:cysteine-rich receptor-like protein kinase 44 isoform X1 n=1 Tax=Oryza sativa subsp. japonica TaxID=39947 RepID=UPI0007754F79|nr:putative receptor-like protein kinase At4g00960 isoform X1 [Oryza sativa Japonica Group]